jgi:hypothetical protein
MQAPPELLKHPTTSSSLQLRLNMAASSCARTDQGSAKLLGTSDRRPKVNSPAQPRGGLYDNATQLHFNASWRTATHEKTSQRPSTVTFISLLFFAPPLASIKGRGGQPSQGLADKPNTRSKGLGLDTLSRPICNPYYKQPKHENTAAQDWM